MTSNSHFLLSTMSIFRDNDKQNALSVFKTPSDDLKRWLVLKHVGYICLAVLAFKIDMFFA